MKNTTASMPTIANVLSLASMQGSAKGQSFSFNRGSVPSQLIPESTKIPSVPRERIILVRKIFLFVNFFLTMRICADSNGAYVSGQSR